MILVYPERGFKYTTPSTRGGALNRYAMELYIQIGIICVQICCSYMYVNTIFRQLFSIQHILTTIMPNKALIIFIRQFTCLVCVMIAAEKRHICIKYHMMNISMKCFKETCTCTTIYAHTTTYYLNTSGFEKTSKEM